MTWDDGRGNDGVEDISRLRLSFKVYSHLDVHPIKPGSPHQGALSTEGLTPPRGSLHEGALSIEGLSLPRLAHSTNGLTRPRLVYPTIRGLHHAWLTPPSLSQVPHQAWHTPPSLSHPTKPDSPHQACLTPPSLSHSTKTDSPHQAKHPQVRRLCISYKSAYNYIYRLPP